MAPTTNTTHPKPTTQPPPRQSSSWQSFVRGVLLKNRSIYTKPPPPHYEIWTDGGSRRKNNSIHWKDAASSWAFFVFAPNREQGWLGCGYSHGMHSLHAELMATIKALEFLQSKHAADNQTPQVTLISDCKAIVELLILFQESGIWRYKPRQHKDGTDMIQDMFEKIERFEKAYFSINWEWAERNSSGFNKLCHAAVDVAAQLKSEEIVFRMKPGQLDLKYPYRWLETELNKRRQPNHKPKGNTL